MANIEYNREQATVKITVPAELWRQRLALKSEVSALEAKIKALDKELGIPKADDIQKRLKLSVDEKAQITVCDGNGDIQGKGSVYFTMGAVIPEGWRSRIS